MSHVVFDSETTGIEPGSRLVEIYSAVINDDEVVIDEFHALVNPEMPIPPDVVGTHGLTTEKLATARHADEVLIDWIGWMTLFGASHTIAHNAPYEIGIIMWELGRADLSLPFELLSIDTCAMARTIKATKKNSLDALVEHYGITRQGDAHRAKGDALACLDYWKIAKGLMPDFAPQPWCGECSDYRYASTLPKHLASLPLAVQQATPFRFAYVDAKGVRTDREIIPYGWAETDKGISFHGLCLMRGERRTFMADRVEV